MSGAPQIATAVTAATARPAATPGHADALAPRGRLAVRLGAGWPARAAWTISRTGRPGLVGIALLLAAAVFLSSTYLQVAADVEALRADLAGAPKQRRTAPADELAGSATALRALPARTDMPAILHQLFDEATQARLAVNTAKYEVKATKSAGVVSYQIAFPVTGPYPQVRAFLDATLARMPAVALSDLAIERKRIGDANVEAELRLTAYTLATGAPGAPGGAAPATGRETSRARPASDRVVAPTHASALFAQHSWYVPPTPKPAPPPAEPPPPPPPTAPPLPYAFLGSFTPDGAPPVFFLSRGDRVIDAHLGDRLDGLYRLESAAGGQLVFVYLPLDIRQNLAAGVAK